LKNRKKRPPSPVEKAASNTNSNGRLRAALPALAPAVLALLAFSNSFDARFTLDSATLILKDTRIRQVIAANIDQIVRHTYYWPSGEAGIYRPFTTLTFLFNYAVLGNRDSPAGYHWINLLLHLVNVLLVYKIASGCLRRLSLAFFITAIWAVHPLLTEAVTSIAGRADLLAAMAILSGLPMYLRSKETTGWKRGAWLTGLMTATALGVFSKESAVCIPGVLAAYELSCREAAQRGKALLIGCLVTLPPIAAMLWQRSIVLSSSLPVEFPFVDNPIVGADFWTGRLTAVKVTAHYLRLMVWPATLSADYSWPEIPLAQGSLRDWVAWIAVLAIAAAIVLLCRNSRAALFFTGFTVVTFLPVSNLLISTGTIMAERLFYLPSIGLVGCLVIAIGAFAQRTGMPRFAPIICCAAIMMCAIRTWSRNLDWKDDLNIVTSSLEASPNSYKLHRQRAASLYEADPRHTNIDEVLAEGDKSVELLDPLPDAQNNRDAWRLAGGYHLVKGDLLRLNAGQDLSTPSSSPESSREYRKASELLLRAVAIDENYRAAYGSKVKAAKARNPAVPEPPAPDSDLYQFLAASYVRLGDASQALSATRKSLALRPRTPAAYRQIAYTFAQYNRVDDAAEAIIMGIILAPDVALGNDLLKLYDEEAFAGSCVKIRGSNGQSINHGCGRVRKHFCGASAEAARALIEEGKPDLAREQQDRYSREFSCPVQGLQAIPK
jgi:tetratricopeptide (TPR) repeat protein